MKAEEVLKEVQRYKKIGTNADKIRSMSDEELAEIIMCPAEFDNVEKHCRSVDANNETDCIECCLKWLQHRYEEEQD